jgi:hypothetical protein
MSEFAYGAEDDENDGWDEVEEDDNEMTNENPKIDDDDITDTSNVKIYEIGDVESK